MALGLLGLSDGKSNLDKRERERASERERERDGEKERERGRGETALFTILCSEAVSRASPHCRGNHLVRLTGVAKAIRQRA